MIIVTGGAGFIGSNLIQGLNSMGITQIVVVDDLSDGRKHLNLNRLKIADYIDKNDFLGQLGHFKNVQTIFHQGACSDTLESDGAYMMRNNFTFSKELLQFSLKNQIDFLYASSASVYGNGTNGFGESTDCEYPLNIYAYSKFLFDQYVREILQADKSPSSQIVGLRYFNVYGYQENHKDKMASVAFHLMNQLKNREQLKLFEGSESFMRDFIFVEDVVDVNLFFFKNKLSGIYNCGSGTSRSFLDVALILRGLDPSAVLETIPFPPVLRDKYQTFTEADLSNLRASGYTKPFVSLEEGIERYYHHFIKTGGFF